MRCLLPAGYPGRPSACSGGPLSVLRRVRSSLWLFVVGGSSCVLRRCWWFRVGIRWFRLLGCGRVRSTSVVLLPSALPSPSRVSGGRAPSSGIGRGCVPRFRRAWRGVVVLRGGRCWLSRGLFGRAWWFISSAGALLWRATGGGRGCRVVVAFLGSRLSRARCVGRWGRRLSAAPLGAYSYTPLPVEVRCGFVLPFFLVGRVGSVPCRIVRLRVVAGVVAVSVGPCGGCLVL